MKSNIVKLTLLCATTLSLLGCDFTTPGGKVPAKYLTAAQQMAAHYGGTYNGHFYDWNGMELTHGALTLKLKGDVVTLTFADGSQNDLLGNNCQSHIGAMSGGTLDEQSKQVTSLDFDFDPGRCAANLEGRTLRVDFGTSDSGKPALNLQLADFTQNSQGQPCVQPPYGGGITCSNPETFSFTGLFSK